MHFLCGLELEISSVQRERKKERDIERERYLFWPEGHTGELLCVNVSSGMVLLRAYGIWMHRYLVSFQ